MGSTTKFFTAVSALQLAQKGTIDLDEKVAPHIDAYLANPLPCDKAPANCEKQCAPHAHCYVKSTVLCKLRTKAEEAACSYCFRYLHCFASAGGVPAKLTLENIWENNATINQVTFRMLLTMNSGAVLAPL